MIRESSPCRLLVEGADDKHCVIHLMKRHNTDWDNAAPCLPYVYDCNGFAPLIASLGVSAKSYRRLGIVVDANADMHRRWIQVREGLNRAGVVLPESPDANGTIGPGIYADWRVGVWLMPDNQHRGQLEDFLGKLVPANDACWAYATQAATYAKGLGARFPDAEFCKAGIHTWLAWQETPGLPFGTAITAKYFSIDSPEAIKFAQWFKRLFS